MDLLEQEDIEYFPLLVQAKHTELGRVLFNIFQRTHDRLDRQAKEQMQINDADMRKDFRWRLGAVEILYDILQIPDEALAQSNELNKIRRMST